MKRIVVSAVGFVLLVALGLFVYQKMPQVRALAACYEKTHEIYTEKYLVSRRAWTKEEQICRLNKLKIIQGAECFYREENRLEALKQELPILKRIAKMTTRASKELDEVVLDHNQQCRSEDTKIEPHELRDIELKYF